MLFSSEVSVCCGSKFKALLCILTLHLYRLFNTSVVHQPSNVWVTTQGKTHVDTLDLPHASKEKESGIRAYQQDIYNKNNYFLDSFSLKQVPPGQRLDIIL